MRVWRWSAAAVVWVLAVSVVAGVAWFAIDSAGHQVGGAADTVRLVPSGPAPGMRTGTTGAGGRPGDTLSPGPSASPSGTSATAQPSTPGTDPPPSPSPGTPGTPATSTVATRTSPTAGGAVPPPPAEGTPTGTPRTGLATPWPTPRVPGPGSGQTGTFSSAGGDLIVRCGGDQVEGWAVLPADGWRAEATPGPRGVLDAVFTADRGEVLEVQVACRDGVPVFVPRPDGRSRG